MKPMRILVTASLASGPHVVLAICQRLQVPEKFAENNSALAIRVSESAMPVKLIRPLIVFSSALKSWLLLPIDMPVPEVASTSA